MIIDAWHQDFVQKDAVDISAIIAAWKTGDLSRGARVSYADSIEQGYESNAAVRACINEIVLSASAVPLIMRNSRDETLENHQLLELIRWPSEYVMYRDIVRWFVVDIIAHGDAFFLLNGAFANRPPSEIQRLRPDKMEPVTNSRGQVTAFWYGDKGDSDRQRFSADRVVWARMPGMTDSLSSSPDIRAAALDIDLNNESKRWNVDRIRHLPTASSILHTDQHLSRAQMEDLLEQMRKSNGRAGLNNPWILSNGMTVTETPDRPRDAEWDDARTGSRRDICSVLNVPPEIIGDHENATYSNYQEARRSFYSECVFGWLDHIVAVFQRQFVKRYGEDGLRLEYDKSQLEVVQEAEAMRWSRYTDAVAAGVMTVNEARELMALPPVDGGDVFLPSASQIPTSEYSGDGMKG